VKSSPPAIQTVQAAQPPATFVDPDVSSDASTTSSVAPAPAPSQPAPASVRPSFDCREAQTAAQRMVCNDARLAAADRRMSRAYAAALAARGSEDQLDAEQADWLAIREDAARYSSRAVLNVYEQRTRELEAMVAEAPQ